MSHGGEAVQGTAQPSAFTEISASARSLKSSAVLQPRPQNVDFGGIEFN
jgi:hypothetical protein